VLYLQDSHGIISKATLTNKPNVESLSKWYCAIKYIDEVLIDFYYIKGNGAHFYFKYRESWHKILKGSFKQEEIVEHYRIIEFSNVR
jgi:hypothetical protein